MTQPLNVWHGSTIRVTWLNHIREMTHLYVWHDSLIRAIWLIQGDMTQLYAWHDSITSIPTLHKPTLTLTIWPTPVHAHTHAHTTLHMHTIDRQKGFYVHMNELRHTHEWVTAHTQLNHVTCEWVMSQTRARRRTEGRRNWKIQIARDCIHKHVARSHRGSAGGRGHRFLCNIQICFSLSLCNGPPVRWWWWGGEARRQLFGSCST